MLYKIPLEIIELDNNSFHLFVSGSINGQLCDFIIDTGASQSVFAMHLVGAILDDVPKAQPDIQSAGISAGALESHIGRIGEFSLGEFRLTDMNVVLIDLSSINELYSSVSDKSIWGLIGSDFLLKYKARLDYGKKSLTLQKRKLPAKRG